MIYKRFFTLSMFFVLLTAITTLAAQQTAQTRQSSADLQQKPTAAGASQEQQHPWYRTFQPLREFHVSPSGTGNGKRITSPMSFEKALENAEPGDLYWLHEGTYQGLFGPTRNGTEKDPIVFRAATGEHVTILGAIHADAAFNWFWGLEITDPQGVAQSGGVEMLKPGIRLINNVIHEQLGKVGVGAWMQGKGHVVYGNIIYHQIPSSNNPHNLYIQNDFENWGYKYVVNNIILDANSASPDTYNVHGYTEKGLVTGLHFEGNVIKSGKFLIGGFNMPADNEVVRNNYFFDSTVQFGFRRPTQVLFQDNYLAHSSIVSEWFWGAGETQFHETAHNIYTGNQVFQPSGDSHVRFRTSAYLPSGRCEGCPAIQPADTWDKNQYSAPFRATFHANDKNMGTIGFQEWKKATAEAGKAFDAHSMEVPVPVTPKTVLIKNEYDPTRAHLAIYNWSQQSQVRVDLSELLASGSKYSIYNAKELDKAPILSGVYQAPVELSVKSGESAIFVVIRK